MDKAVWVGLGGFLGAWLRYAVGGALARWKAGWTFPIETLIVNVVGCLAIGFLAEVAETRGLFSPTTRLFVFIGLLGGFTTFSTYGYETFQLMREGQVQAAVLSTLLQVGLGLGGVWAGHIAARMVWGT